MLDKLKNIFETQKKMNEIKKELENISVNYETANQGMKICMSGTQKVISFNINSEYLAKVDKSVLEKDLVQCVNGASDKVQRVAAEKLKSSLGDLKIPGV
ncbi:MAG: YbaB/EbfC family nucleoid-associated protein [Candidatus Omnitrophota bacterium]